MQRLQLAILLGTSREGRLSEHAARYVAAYARTLPDVDVTFVDPREYQMPADGDNPETRNEAYAELTRKADAFYIVTPEYNHSFPGSLKRLLDSEYDNYLHKPVGLAGVSNGSWGGVRACEALLPVMHTLGMPVIRHELYFPRAQDLFDEAGALRPEHHERYQKNLADVFGELLPFARVCKQLRQEETA